METIGFVILWTLAAFHTLSAVLTAFMVGKPKANTTFTTTEMWITAGYALLLIYALVLISFAR